ncbi:hypothetical protein [Candidatus Enterococcus ferrettii]|uniref:Uncharacterized protein n=1 Tax=Candidatus Enterococcus ferrettii TaxID=2815324 RepID=A0ABV0EQ94_9ENTE|nr:hypothetical protein [Enterococcus sp. 665A]MBO1341002.1 hypothetical protein [Enterococcus sp. 665A]
MFGLGKQKRDTYHEPQQDDYFYDEYDNEGYEGEYGYDSYPEDSYERSMETYIDYEPNERERQRRRANIDGRHDRRYDNEEQIKSSRGIEDDSTVQSDSMVNQEIERLEETVAQLKYQLETKHTEMTNMASSLTEKEQKIHDQQMDKEKAVQELQKQVKQQMLDQKKDYERQLDQISNQNKQLTTQLQNNQKDQSETLMQAHLQIEELKKTQIDNEEMKAELATILIETKKQERAILERAEFEAKGIRSQAEQEAHQVIHDASLELRVMKQEIKNYRKRLRSVQEETTQFFVRLLANSDALLEDE